MYKIEVENRMNQSYLVVTPNDKNMVNAYQIRMACENKIDGLLPMDVREINGVAKIYYEITGCEEFTKRFEKDEIPFEECKKLIEGIHNAYLFMEEYLLGSELLCVNPKGIFWDNLHKEVRFMLLPKAEETKEASMQRLAEYLLEKIDHNDEYAVSVAYRFYKDSRQEHFSFHTVYQNILEAERRKEIERLEEEKLKQERMEREQMKIYPMPMANQVEVLSEPTEIFHIPDWENQSNDEPRQEKKWKLEADTQSRDCSVKEETKEPPKKLFLFGGAALACLILFFVAPVGEIFRKCFLFGAVLIACLGVYQMEQSKKRQVVVSA